MAVGKGLCKARNCFGTAQKLAVIIVRPFKGGHFPLIFETPLEVCEHHCTQEIAQSLMVPENLAAIREGLKESGFKEELKKDQLEVNFVSIKSTSRGRAGSKDR